MFACSLDSGIFDNMNSFYRVYGSYRDYNRGQGMASWNRSSFFPKT